MDKEHFRPKKKISFKLPQKVSANKPSKIPIMQKSPRPQDPSIIIPVMSNISSPENEQSGLRTSQVADNLTSDIKADAVWETSVIANELSSSLNTNGGKSIDSGFMDEKNKQKVDVQSFPLITTRVANAGDEFLPLEEVDQALTRTASQGSLTSTVTSTSVVGDECSSSGCDCIRMSKANESREWIRSAELTRPKSACDNYIIHHLASDQTMKRHDSLPHLESSTLLASKINLLQNEKVLL